MLLQALLPLLCPIVAICLNVWHLYDASCCRHENTVDRSKGRWQVACCVGHDDDDDDEDEDEDVRVSVQQQLQCHRHSLLFSFDHDYYRYSCFILNIYSVLWLCVLW